MQRKHKFLWLKAWAWCDYTEDGMFKKPKIKKKDKVMCGKLKRRYFKNLTGKDIKDFDKGDY